MEVYQFEGNFQGPPENIPHEEIVRLLGGEMWSLMTRLSLNTSSNCFSFFSPPEGDESLVELLAKLPHPEMARRDGLGGADRCAYLVRGGDEAKERE